MSQQLINLGSVANDGTGFPLRTGGQDINANFTELYASKMTANPMEATYGAVGDGVADDTTAVQNALTAAAGGTCWLPDGKTFLINQVLVTSATRIAGPGTLKIESSFSLGAHGDGVLYCTAPVVVEGIAIDGNSKGRTGITLAAGSNASIVRNVTITNITDAADSGSTGGIIVAAPGCRILDCGFTNLVFTSAQTNASMPRCVSFNTGADHSTLIGLRGTAVNVGVVVAAPYIAILDTVIDGALNDGFYCLSNSTYVTIDGGTLHNVCNGVVFEAANPTVRNLTILADTGVNLNGVNLDFSPSNVVVENVRVYAPTVVTNLVAVRANIGTVNGLLVKGCSWIAGVDSSAALALHSGTINQLTVMDNYFEAHQLAAIVGEGRFVDHTNGDAVFYRGNTFRLVDDEGTLTGSNVFRVTTPTLSAFSDWRDNLLITDPSHKAQISVGIGTGLFQVSGDPCQLQAATQNLRELGANGDVGQRRVSSTAAPTTNTWAQGDFVLNITPSELGSAGSKYVILGWSCTVAGTPGTWLQCRTLTGN